MNFETCLNQDEWAFGKRINRIYFLCNANILQGALQLIWSGLVSVGQKNISIIIFFSFNLTFNYLISINFHGNSCFDHFDHDFPFPVQWTAAAIRVIHISSEGPTRYATKCFIQEVFIYQAAIAVFFAIWSNDLVKGMRNRLQRNKMAFNAPFFRSSYNFLKFLNFRVFIFC